jgi:prepilin-type N-terminal cleavage/methylation domain-containing protein
MKSKPQAGFTLIEMLVSIALFAIVMVVCVGALLALVGANKKAQALESTMNNLNISIDDMVRNLREGSGYIASGACSSNTDGVTSDCTGGGTEIAFTTFTGHAWVYEYIQSGQPGCTTLNKTGGCIMRSEDGGTFSSLTAPEVSITSMEFYVVGTSPNDNTQPRAIITLQGNAGAANNVKDSTTFHLQATAVQRALDL